MTFGKAFKLASYMLLLAGFVSLWASEAVGPVVSGLYLLAIVASWRYRLFCPNWAQLVLFFLLIVFFLLDALMLSDFVSATVHVLILVSLIKLYSATSERDYLFLYFVSFGFLLFASAYTISISFLVSLVFYIFCAILTFILFESKRAYEENRNSPFSMKSYVNVALVITGLIILISIPIFVVIPRASFGLFRVDRHLDLNMTGFSDQLKLGDMGEIIVSSNILMRVKVDTDLENLPPDLKWRGIALDRYNGKQWSKSRDRFQRIRSDSYGRIFISKKRRNDEFMVQQTIFLEPFSNVLFGAPQMVLIAAESLRRSAVFEDGHDSIIVYRRSRGPIKYVVYSDLIRRNERLTQPIQGSVPRSIQRRYTQLPAIHPQIEKLALDVTREQEGFLNKALLMERFLKRNYGYSLANISAGAEDPLYDFLHVTKAGHCEFFATAQAVMMRVLGIPARIVNGFRLGEFNDFSGYLTVRQSDAHSWVEGYFPGPGWVEFDPTPAASIRKRSFSLGTFFGQLLDAVDIFWTELVTFDRIKQVGFFRSLGSSLQSTWANISTASLKLGEVAKLKWLDQLKDLNFSGFLYVLSGLLLLVVVTVVHRYRRYFRAFLKQNVLGRRSSEIAPEYYMEMLHLLDRKGLSKRAAETPVEFANRIQISLSTPIPAKITWLYYRNRFGNFPLEEGDLPRIYGWLRKLR